MLRVLLLSFCLLGSVASAAERPSFPSLHKSVFGILLHDRGPFSDRHESGVDPNWELQFQPLHWSPWHWIGAPNLMIGVIPNFVGDTSTFYGGLSYELSLSQQWLNRVTRDISKSLFVSGSASIALHDGPLHKDKTGCQQRSDCGFGYRALPRLAAEVGGYFNQRHGLSIFYDHMSHKHVLPGENEGIDHIGLRYHFKFHTQ